MSLDPDPSGTGAEGSAEGADAPEAAVAKTPEKLIKEKEFLKGEGKEKLDKEELKVEGKEKHDKEGKEKHDKEAGKEKHDKEKQEKEKHEKEKQDKDGKNEKLEKEKHDKEAGKEKHDKEKHDKEGIKDKHDKEGIKDKHDKERGKDFAKEKDKLEQLEKLPDIPGKTVAEGPPGFDPATAGIDADTLLAHAASLEETVRQLRHFIEQSQRPDLTEGALRDEPDQQDEEG